MVFLIVPFLIQLAVTVAITAVAFLLAPKPKQSKPEVRDLESPTADSGRPIPVVFGTKTVSGVNVLWFGEKRTKTRQV